MRKIPTLFKRDPENMSRVLSEVNPAAQWVIEGEGTPTQKFDGTCTMLDDEGQWWARREVKPGKNPPENYRAEETDPNTGKTVGWEPIHQSSFYGAWHEAWKATDTPPGIIGTYELCGPKVNGNPEGLSSHVLIEHGQLRMRGIPVTFEGLRDFLSGFRGEGIVWHHEDGIRMVKVKRRDFGFK